MLDHHIFLRRFSKVLCLATISLIFLGALVKSTESGLSVPDWPTTYGKFMFSFPLDQMVGGIKYEHTHRMLASIVGLMSLMLCVLLFRSTVPSWIKKLSVYSFTLVVGQGLLGGLTVIHFLPVSLSSLHGVFGQTFLITTIAIAYGLSVERGIRLNTKEEYDGKFIRFVIILAGMVFLQLIIGNILRHTNSGLAIPDFPTTGGTMIPTMNQAMLDRINGWRFEHNLDPVKMGQVHIHLTHRIWGVLILLKLIFINQWAYKKLLHNALVMKTLFWLNIAVVLQIGLGIGTVLTIKEPITTTLHVTTGALVLALCFLLFLRSAPTTLAAYKNAVARK